MSSISTLKSVVSDTKSILLRAIRENTSGLYFPKLISFEQFLNEPFSVVQDDKSSGYVIIRKTSDIIEVVYNKIFLKNLDTNDGIALAKLAIMHECLEQYFQDLEVIESVIERFPKITQLGFPEIKPNHHNQLNHCLVNLYLEKLFASEVPSKEIIEESRNLTFPLFNYEKVLEDLKTRIKKYDTNDDAALATFSVMLAHLKIITSDQLNPETLNQIREYVDRTFELEKALGF